MGVWKLLRSALAGWQLLLACHERRQRDAAEAIAAEYDKLTASSARRLTCIGRNKLHSAAMKKLPAELKRVLDKIRQQAACGNNYAFATVSRVDRLNERDMLIEAIINELTDLGFQAEVPTEYHNHDGHSIYVKW